MKAPTYRFIPKYNKYVTTADRMHAERKAREKHLAREEAEAWEYANNYRPPELDEEDDWPEMYSSANKEKGSTDE